MNARKSRTESEGSSQMPETKRTITTHLQNDSLEITYDPAKREFELAFDPELDEYTGESHKILIHLVLSERTVRAMGDALPPLDPESVH
jgi:hypothetical protein